MPCGQREAPPVRSEWGFPIGWLEIDYLRRRRHETTARRDSRRAVSKLMQAPSRERANTGNIHPSYAVVQQQVSNSAAKAPSAGNAKATARRAHAPAPRCRARQGGSMKKVKSAADTVSKGGICRQKNSKSPPSYSPRFAVGNHQKRAHTHTASGSNANETTPTGEKRERQEREFITECRVKEKGRKNKTNLHFIANPEPRASRFAPFCPYNPLWRVPRPVSGVSPLGEPRALQGASAGKERRAHGINMTNPHPLYKHKIPICQAKSSLLGKVFNIFFRACKISEKIFQRELDRIIELW